MIKKKDVKRKKVVAKKVKKVIVKKKLIKKAMKKPRVDLRRLNNKTKLKTKKKVSPKQKKEDPLSQLDNERDVDKDIIDATDEAERMLKEIFKVDASN